MASPIHPAAIKKMICFYYLVSYCPPEHVSELKKVSQKMRGRLVNDAGLNMDQFADLVIPEVARRMLAFQQATREPEAAAIQELTQVMKNADGHPEEASIYQTVMGKITAHPGRAKPANRLHRQKGCAFCEAPCRYGFFTLMCDPDFKTLQAMLDAENKKIAQERNVVKLLWTYTSEQIWKVLEAQGGMIHAEHLGNLSYCLLMLGTAKSRFALPEKQLKMFQALNQQTIRSLPSPVVSLVVAG
jgi:hypothetical protein